MKTHYHINYINTKTYVKKILSVELKILLNVLNHFSYLKIVFFLIKIKYLENFRN